MPVPSLVDDLRERLSKGRVVVVAGAGIAAGATRGAPTATWQGLLESGLSHCESLYPDFASTEGKQARDWLSQGSVDGFLQVANLISARLDYPTGGEFGRWLRESIGSLKVEEPDLIHALVDLQALLLTTNYDTLIEQETGLDTVTWKQTAVLQRTLQGDYPAVVHLHGSWDRPESVVLGSKSYRDLQADQGMQAVFQAIRVSYSLLYVGVGNSLSDPHFQALFEWVRKAFAGKEEYRHFTLCRQEDVNLVQSTFTSNDRTFALSYGSSYDALTPFLMDLRPPSTPARTTPSPLGSEDHSAVNPKLISLSDSLRNAVRSEQRVVAVEASLFPAPSREMPRLPHEGIERPALAEQVTAGLLSNRLVFLTGSTGTGKTFLARQVAASIPGRWIWVSAVGFTTLQVRLSLQLLEQDLRGSTDPVHVLLDEIGLSTAHLTHYIDAFRSLCDAVTVRGGYVLVTSHRPPPALLLSESELNFAIVAVPHFTPGEIAALCAKLGCADRERAETWSRLIHMHTGGHPRLAFVRVQQLSALGWPSATPGDVVTPPSEVLTSRSEARALLDSIPEPARELLLRLSIAVQPFRRDHALSFAEVSPPIPQPGGHFDGLHGPWIEAADTTHFRLSPLLQNSANETWSKERIRELHGEFAEVLLRSPPFTQIEAGAILFHGILGSNPRAIASTSLALVTVPRAQWELFAKDHSWFLTYMSQTQGPLYPDDPWSSFAIRLLQLRVALVVDPSQVRDTLLALKAEHVAQDREREHASEACLLASQLLFVFRDVVDPDLLLQQIEEILHKPDTFASVYRHLDDAQRLDPLLFGEHSSHASVLFDIVASGQKNIDRIHELLAALDRADDDLRRDLIASLTDEEDRRINLLDSAFVHENGKPTPDWTNFTLVLRECVAKGRQWPAAALANSAARLIGLVLDEQLGDREGALSELDTLEEELGRSDDTLRSRATILSRSGDSAGALRCWRDVARVPAFGRVFAWRTAALDAEVVGELDEAIGYLTLAEDSAQLGGMGILATGLASDSSWLLWELGRKAEALAKFAAALEELDRTITDSDHLATQKLAVQQGLGSIMLMLERKPEIPSGMLQPYVGMCSDPELLTNELLKSLVAPRSDLIWALLLEAEFLSEDTSRLFASYGSRIRSSDDPFAAMLVCHVEAGWALRNGSIAELPLLASRIEVLGIPTGVVGSPEATADASSSAGKYAAAGLLACALVNATASRRGRQELLENWCEVDESARETAASPTVLGWIDMLQQDSQTRMRMLRDSTVDSETILLAASLLGDELGPTDAATAQGAALLHLYPLPWRVDAGKALSTVIEHYWREAATQQALLRTPRLTVPPLLASCDEPGDSFGKAARMLIQAGQAVGFSVPNAIRTIAGTS